MKPHTMARLSLDIPQQLREDIGELETLLQAGSITETVRRSIHVTRAMLSHRQAGGRVLLRDADGTCREVIFT